MQFQGGTVVFPLQNTQWLCAAYSQGWLAWSLTHGRPLLSPGVIRDRWLLARARAIAGLGTRQALALGGMAVAGPTITLRSAGWEQAFWQLAQCGEGMWYLTTRIRIPPPDDYFHHAMACCIGSDGAVHHLEAEHGLVRFPGVAVHRPAAAAWYAARMRTPVCERLEIYPVELAGKRGSAGAVGSVAAGAVP